VWTAEQRQMRLQTAEDNVVFGPPSSAQFFVGLTQRDQSLCYAFAGLDEEVKMRLLPFRPR
jgi:hypothetical protein